MSHVTNPLRDPTFWTSLAITVSAEAAQLAVTLDMHRVDALATTAALGPFAAWLVRHGVLRTRDLDAALTAAKTVATIAAAAEAITPPTAPATAAPGDAPATP